MWFIWEGDGWDPHMLSVEMYAIWGQQNVMVWLVQDSPAEKSPFRGKVVIFLGSASPYLIQRDTLYRNLKQQAFVLERSI